MKVNSSNCILIRYSIQSHIVTKCEEIDRIQVQGMYYTKKQCRKLYGGYVPWTLEATKVHACIELWILVDGWLYGYNVSTRTTMCKKRQVDYQDDTSVDLL